MWTLGAVRKVRPRPKSPYVPTKHIEQIRVDNVTDDDFLSCTWQKRVVVLLDSDYAQDHLELTGGFSIVRCVRHDRGKHL